MVDAIQKAMQDVCVSALAAMALLVALHGFAVAVRCFFARIRHPALAVLLSLVAVSSVILGSDKTNGLLQAVLPFNPQMQSVQHPQMQPVPFALPSVPRLASPSPRASADMPFRARNWNRRGAWNDSFRCAFPGEWVFPFGTGHLGRVEVCSQGRILPRYGSTNVIADVGVPLQIVNPLTSFGCSPTASNSYVFAWTNAVVGRVSREDVANAETIDAAIELFRNGDVAITTNGVTELRPRDLPFPHDGYGQDAEWVMANFTNATEILAQGYTNWVDAQVGEGLTNGLYKLTVTVPEVPPETTQLTVGDLSVAVTNAGDYVFLLEKGIDYQCGTVPFLTNVTYSAVDDVPQTRGGLRSLSPEEELPRWAVDDAFSVTSHVAGVSTSDAVGDVVLRAEFSSAGWTNAVSRQLTVVRTGNVTIPAAPTNGLVALVNTPVTMLLDCEPQGAGAFLTTMWHTRRLKSDGTHEEWQLASYGQLGVTTVFTPTQGGIYQVRATASVESGGYDERFYVWDADEDSSTGTKKAGALKSFGVCNEQWQINLRNCAKSFLGSTAYVEMAAVPAQYGFSSSPGWYDVYKCNLFVAHRAVQSGLTVPAIHGRLWRSHPPLANEWGNRSFAIEGWLCVDVSEFPQAGFVSSLPTGNDTPGHLGIVDFDGMGISAGIHNVNRRFNACGSKTVLRKYNGSNAE